LVFPFSSIAAATASSPMPARVEILRFRGLPENTSARRRLSSIAAPRRPKPWVSSTSPRRAGSQTVSLQLYLICVGSNWFLGFWVVF